MARKCIIHIGMHKTGSGSIQKSLSRNLKDPAFVYPRLGVPNHSVPIVTLFAGDADGGNTKVKVPDDIAKLIRMKDRTRAKLLEAIKASDADMVISGEEITKLSESQIVAMREFFAPYFSEIIVVAYVRPPVSFMQSSFQQRLKRGMAAFDPLELYPKYKNRFEKFEKAMGAENVRWWLYDPATFKDGDVVRDFCDRLGIDISNAPKLVSNESFSGEAIKVLYCYRRYYPKERNAESNADFLKALAEVQGPKFRFAPAVTKVVQKRRKSDIEWMQRRLGASLKEPKDARPGDISEEADVLKPDDSSVRQLHRLVGLDEDGSTPSASPETVADLAHRLHQQVKDNEGYA